MAIEEYLSTQLQAGETILALVRRHAVLLIPPLLLTAMLVLGDFFFLAWLFSHGQWGAITFVVGLVVAAWVATRSIYLWRMNVFAVTSERVIDIDQRGLFERHVSEATLDKIQDVRYVIKGLWATMFSFGTVIVQTAGNTTSIDADGIHRPVELQRLITDTQNGKKKSAQPSTNILDVRRIQRED